MIAMRRSLPSSFHVALGKSRSNLYLSSENSLPTSGFTRNGKLILHLGVAINVRLGLSPFFTVAVLAILSFLLVIKKFHQYRYHLPLRSLTNPLLCKK